MCGMGNRIIFREGKQLTQGHIALQAFPATFTQPHSHPLQPGVPTWCLGKQVWGTVPGLICVFLTIFYQGAVIRPIYRAHCLNILPGASLANQIRAVCSVIAALVTPGSGVN